MTKKERLKKVRAMTAGISPDKWSEEAKHLFVEIIKDDYHLVNSLLNSLLTENPGKEEYVIKLDENNFSMMLIALDYYLRDTVPRLLHPVGFVVHEGYFINTVELSKQLDEISDT